MASRATGGPPPTVIIVGAGIIGLACAIKLQARLGESDDGRGVEVLVAAREWPGFVPGAPLTRSVDYASMWAGAHVRPIPGATPQLQREAGWLRRTVAEFGCQAESEPWCGVTRLAGVEFLEEPHQSYYRRDDSSSPAASAAAAFERETGLAGYRELAPAELPAGVALGFRYETFCINAPLYCEHLLRTFLLRGGKTMRVDLKSEWEAFTLRDDVLFVVNASGVGFGDPKCFPTRGQTVVTNLSVAKTVTRQYRDGSWSFLIPRFYGGGTVVGGTKQPGDWRSAPDSATRDRLLSLGLELEPYARGGDDDAPLGGGFRETRPGAVGVISDVVGRRPTREGGMRLQVETKPTLTWQGSGSDTSSVIHAYGAGGRGYEISWGVAEEVIRLAEPLLTPGTGTL
ncbi:hypothetical protein CDD83_9020 [Cordyceps sp. RAO-2017]|nr:hypothetical protein CDD83_9020 [Cordyceps sp. RAO-2017]